MSRWTVFPVFISFAGCRHRCLYCRQPAVADRENILAGAADQIRALFPEARRPRPGGRGELAFYGGSFTSLPRPRQAALLDLAAPYLKRGDISGIRISARPDALEPENVKWLAERGVATVEIGLQSMDDGVLKRSGRGHSPEDSRRAAAAVRSGGLRLGLQMMLGLPGDTPEKALFTALEAAALAPDLVRIYPTLVFDKTALADLWRRGEYKPWSLEATVRVLAVLVPLFRSRGIAVARVGLLLNGPISAELEVLAGPYHPALGALVQSAVASRRLRESARLNGASIRTITVNRRQEPIFKAAQKDIRFDLGYTGVSEMKMILKDDVPPGWFGFDPAPMAALAKTGI